MPFSGEPRYSIYKGFTADVSVKSSAIKCSNVVNLVTMATGKLHPKYKIYATAKSERSDQKDKIEHKNR